jgi:hypothetical protein
MMEEECEYIPWECCTSSQACPESADGPVLADGCTLHLS